MPVRTVIERGPKGKKAVAFAIDWPGWSRGAKTPEDALALLETYRDRYRPVAALAGLRPELDGAGKHEIVEDRVGTGSTDFWGISFSASSAEHGPLTEADLERRLALLRACWTYFDDVARRVTPELQRGPRGGGRNRDEVVAHTFGTERTQFAVKLGVQTPPGVMLTPDGLAAHRQAYLDAFREYNAEGRKARTWELQFLLRHTAFHVLDHAWEMEDKTLA